MNLFKYFMVLGWVWIAPALADTDPVTWWDFEKSGPAITLDRIGHLTDTIEGQYRQVAGVKGAALKLDGYTTCIIRQAENMPPLTHKLTVSAWIALGAYPWNWCPIVAQTDAIKAGFRFEAGPRGQIRLTVKVNGQMQTCTSQDFGVGLFQWVHVVGVYDQATGISLYINGVKDGTLNCPGMPQLAAAGPLRIGMNDSALKPSNIHREHGTRPGWFSLDGIIDELKLYDQALSSDSVKAQYAEVTPGIKPPLQPRVLPTGPKGPRRFGAFYTHLKYYDEWDALWAVGSDPDVVVRFADSDVRVVFWRGSRYSPAWVTEKGQWMADQSVEAWDNQEGCFEHMQDRLCLYSHVRIIESNPARVVVHWRYAPVSSSNHLWRVDPKTGRACWVDEYYTIYPDQMGVRKVMWKTDTLGNPHQFQESLPFTGPGQLVSDVIHEQWATVGNLKGQTHELWHVKEPKARTIPEDLILQRYNFRSANKPFIVFESGNEMHYVKDRKLGDRGLDIPGACNHWPVGQALCDGRSVQVADRPTHFLGFPISYPPVHEKAGRSWWNGLYGMTDQTMAQLTEVARSYNHPPALKIQTKGFMNAGYDRGQRAYRIVCADAASTDSLLCSLTPDHESTLANIPLVIENWGTQDVKLTLNGQIIERGKTFRVGHRDLLKGTHLILWIEYEASKPVQLELTRSMHPK